MSRKLKIISLLLAVALLSGCSLRTVDQLYCLPKRSEEFASLQSAIDEHMTDLSYCAPLSGENTQCVQNADLDGDGVGEYLIFTKSSKDKPLHILIFWQSGKEYILSDTIVSTGSAFDLVEYAHIDDKPGYELVVGCQVSDQLTRSVSVYRFNDGKAELLHGTNYTRFLPCDMNSDGRQDLLVLRPGESAESRGIAELYTYSADTIERSNQIRLSESADNLRRIVAGKLYDGQPAVYVASEVGSSAIVTDVCTLVNGHLTNVSFSSESGTGVQTLRNYYVYAEDIDSDGVLELPNLVTVQSPPEPAVPGEQYLIRWFAMTSTGSEITKCYSYHNFQSGWYIMLNNEWASRVATVQQGNAFDFYVWDKDFHAAQKIFTVFAFSGDDRQDQAVQNNRFVLFKTDQTLYAARLEAAAERYGITKDVLMNSFYQIHQDWKTGED